MTYRQKLRNKTIIRVVSCAAADKMTLLFDAIKQSFNFMSHQAGNVMSFPGGKWVLNGCFYERLMSL